MGTTRENQAVRAAARLRVSPGALVPWAFAKSRCWRAVCLRALSRELVVNMDSRETPPLPPGVVARFQALLAQAVNAGEPEPEAMSLATADANGRPSVRVVLLKQLRADGLVFYTNTLSRKGAQLAENAWAATNLHWKHLDLQVQVRSEGRVEPVAEAEADAYFQSRPRGSQIGAWASLQSSPLDQRQTLEARIAQVEARYADAPVPRPPHWSGYRLRPQRLEFWFGRPFRLHERELFELVDGQWREQLLYP